MKATALEYRTAEFRAEGRKVRGLALPFEVETRVGAGLERFQRGSVSTTGEALLNLHHEQTRPLAREPLSLRFEARDDGLHLEADLPLTREADDALALVDAGVLTGLSVEFRASREVMQGGVRVIQAAVVRGVALVVRAAYPQTSLEVRADDGLAGGLPWWALG